MCRLDKQDTAIYNVAKKEELPFAADERMKSNKKAIIYVLLMSIVFGNTPPALAVTSPTVTKKLTINVGDKKTIKVRGSFISSKSFKSSNTKIAKVNSKGTVTAKRAGKCKIKTTVKYRKSKKAKKVYKIQFTTTIKIKKANPTSTKASEPTESPTPTETPNPGWTEPTGLRASKVDMSLEVTADTYINWDGVSNVSPFTDDSGRYCFACDGEKYVTIVKTEDGVDTGDRVYLEKIHSSFGGVACDDSGNYYLVTGEANEGDNTSVETIFVSKYDRNGTLLKTVGDNGSSSLAGYYEDRFYTKDPFHAGNCDIAMNGKMLTVNYARLMYSAHQSNSVFTVNTETMEKVSAGIIYQSHCFAERVVPYKDGFVYAGEGDCYDRAFTIDAITGFGNSKVNQSAGDVFHFWVKEDTLANWDMRTLNNNFAHMGGLANVDGENVALVGTSVKALSEEAVNQNEQLFIQIFNPQKGLATKESYVTEGVRSGIGGPDGNKTVEDYGVKWLTDFEKGISIINPQVVSDGRGNIIILFEKSAGGEYKGVFCMKLGSDGTVGNDVFCLSENARLNPCRMPVYRNGKIYWTGNKNKEKETIYVYNFDVE